MSIAERLTELTAQLQDDSVVQRRQAVAGLAALLRQPACDIPCRDAIVALLRGALEGEAMTSVRDAAAEALRTIPPTRSPSLLPDDRQHMLGVKCPQCGHVTFFDKRHICTDQRYFVRALDRDAAGHELTRLALPCEACGEIITVDVECGGYR
jgi:hypothetical protein